MGQVEKRNRIKKRYIIIIIAVVIIVTVVFAFAQFSAFGYRMTVPLRSFTEVSPNVYIHNDFTKDKDGAVKLIKEARARVADFFGELESNPTIIICDDKNTIAKLGGDHDTTTTAIFKVYSYISLSSEFLNVDVIAHELTHAETHFRVFSGRIWKQGLIPVWFDEGVALQNDYRERYNEAAWNYVTDNGNNVIALGDIDTAEEFYVGKSEETYDGEVLERRYRYIVSRYEVNCWIENNGLDALLNLFDKVNRGDDFNSSYFAE